MTAQTVFFRRRWLRLLCVLCYALITAWLAYLIALDTDEKHKDWAMVSLFIAAFSLHGCYLTWRYARFFFRREFIRFDAKGITVWHNDVARQKTFHVPWANVFDAWADEYQLRRHDDCLCLVWCTDEGGLEHLALKLQGAVWRDARGKTVRGKTLAPLLEAFVRRHLRSTPVPSGLIPADVAEDWRKYWNFGTGDNGDGCLIGVVMVVLALVALTFFIAFMVNAKTISDVTAGIGVTSFLLLLLLGTIYILYDSLMHWLSGLSGRRFVRIDPVGVHYWRYGMTRNSEADIPWASIHAVSPDSYRLDNGSWVCSLHLVYYPYAGARYLRHIQYDTGSNKQKTEEAAANIRLHCPNLFKFRGLPQVTLTNAQGNDKG